MQERQIEMIYLCCVVESKIFAQGGYKSHRVGEFNKRRSVCPFIPFKMHNQRIILNSKSFVFKRPAIESIETTFTTHNYS